MSDAAPTPARTPARSPAARRREPAPARPRLGAGLWLGFALASPSAACEAGWFACEVDDDCRGGGNAGVCEPQGFCSFASEACASGRAWGGHTPPALAGQCLPRTPFDQPGTADTWEPGEDDGPGRADGSGGDEAGERDDAALHADGGGPPHRCDDGERNGDESDVDCGGHCLACALCQRCDDDDDCDEGECLDGACSVHEEVTLDWRYDCGPLAFDPVLLLPPGRYRAHALPSGGSKWSYDAAVGGLTWAWFVDCTGLSLGELRTPPGTWYADAPSAFAALTTTEVEIELADGVLACGISDTFCQDNRGGVRFELTRVCPP
ncbi:MAG: hypothetical protein K1X88_02420 [Nannocystaceae bacterium]|nr:hypothetical protein [Nannocystaceae bacterium]